MKNLTAVDKDRIEALKGMAEELVELLAEALEDVERSAVYENILVDKCEFQARFIADKLKRINGINPIRESVLKENKGDYQDSIITQQIRIPKINRTERQQQ